MEKQIDLVEFNPRRNITRVTYTDNTFETFPGNVVGEKAGVEDKEGNILLEQESKSIWDKIVSVLPNKNNQNG
jgi:hypothetical protein